MVSFNGLPAVPAGAASLTTARDTAQIVANSALTTVQNVQTVLIPQGRLFVPSSYWYITSPQTTTLQAANDQIDYSWVQECDMGLSSVSIYVGAVTTPGNVNLALWSDSSGVPGALIASLGTVASGSVAGWVRATFTAQQLYRNTRYHLIISGTASTSLAIASNRNTGTVGTGYSGDCNSYTALAGAGTWTPLQMSSLDANFLVILNSGTNGNPQICYGHVQRTEHSHSRDWLADNSIRRSAHRHVRIDGLDHVLRVCIQQLRHPCD